MKKLIKSLAVLLLITSLSSCWTRLGDLTIAANRSIDTKTEYVELKRYVEGKGVQRKNATGALEDAVDDCIRQVQGGELLKNVSILISDNGRRVKVTGDVWGKP